MHPHNIALAEARAAELQRATIRRATTVPGRRHLRALLVAGLAATAVLAALVPTGALARPIDYTSTAAHRHVDGAAAPKSPQDRRALAQTSSLAGTTSLPRRADLRSPDARDAAEGRGMDRTPQIVVVRGPSKPQPAPADGIAWGDAGIGAGSALGFSLIAVGGALFVAHRRRAAHAPPPVAGL
jgi:hypothetical protein